MEDESQLTRASLLFQIRDAQNANAWERFADIYRPIVYGFCRNKGLQAADAEDIAQEVLRTVARAMESFEYDRGKGKFRNWLLTVTRNKLNNFWSRRDRQPRPAGESTLEAFIEGEPTPGEQGVWDREYHGRLFAWASDQVRPMVADATWQAFWRTTIDERDGKEVAESLGMSVGAVYVAKSRVLARLKEAIASIDGDSELPQVRGAGKPGPRPHLPR